MKAAGWLVVAAVVGAGAFALYRARKSPPVLGVDPGTGFQRGLVSGKMYPIGIGEPGAGGTLHSVFSPDDPSLLLLTFVAGPSGKSLTAQNNEAPAEALQLATQDFGFA